jgi:pentatricopeptide repeat protein
MSLIGALGNAGELKEMDKVLDEFARFDHRPGLDVITKMIYYHGSNGDIDG